MAKEPNRLERLAAMLAHQMFLGMKGRLTYTPREFWTNSAAIGPSEKREARRMARALLAAGVTVP